MSLASYPFTDPVIFNDMNNYKLEDVYANTSFANSYDAALGSPSLIPASAAPFPLPTLYPALSIDDANVHPQQSLTHTTNNTSPTIPSPIVNSPVMYMNVAPGTDTPVQTQQQSQPRSARLAAHASTQPAPRNVLPSPLSAGIAPERRRRGSSKAATTRDMEEKPAKRAKTAKQQEPSDDSEDSESTDLCFNSSQYLGLSPEEIQALLEENNLKKQRLARKAALARASRQKKKSKLESLEEQVQMLQDALAMSEARVAQYESMVMNNHNVNNGLNHTMNAALVTAASTPSAAISASGAMSNSVHSYTITAPAGISAPASTTSMSSSCSTSYNHSNNGSPAFPHSSETSPCFSSCSSGYQNTPSMSPSSSILGLSSASPSMHASSILNINTPLRGDGGALARDANGVAAPKLTSTMSSLTLSHGNYMASPSTSPFAVSRLPMLNTEMVNMSTSTSPAATNIATSAAHPTTSAASTVSVASAPISSTSSPELMASVATAASVSPVAAPTSLPATAAVVAPVAVAAPVFATEASVRELKDTMAQFMGMMMQSMQTLQATLIVSQGATSGNTGVAHATVASAIPTTAAMPPMAFNMVQASTSQDATGAATTVYTNMQ